MDYRALGRTDLRVSVLGFGCGDIGGLIVRGAPAERERAVARALDLGINYFDTAPSYGDGRSETHLGRALAALRADVYVGTKCRVDPRDPAGAAAAVTRSLETSLRRLGRERVDLLQLHNAIGAPDGVAARDVLAAVAPALVDLRAQGKVRFFGLTARGDTDALHDVLGGGVFDTVQVFYNLLNPSAGSAVPAGFPAQNYGPLLAAARAQRMGVIVVRALAGGALSGAMARHPVARPNVDPIASGPDYASDVARARRLEPLVTEGHVETLVEAALRFPLGHDAVSTVLLGVSAVDQLESAARAIAKGSLPPGAVARLDALWRDFVSPARPPA